MKEEPDRCVTLVTNPVIGHEWRKNQTDVLLLLQTQW
jgi:hypothetical protein